MKPDGVHHLAVVVADLDGAVDFYANVLGLQEIRRWTREDDELRSVWFAVGNTEAFLAVERGQPAEVKAGAEPEPGWHCVALKIEAQQRKAWEDHLASNGYPVVKRTDFTLYVCDPENNLIGLSHFPDAKPASVN